MILVLRSALSGQLLRKATLLGLTLGFILISTFVFGVDRPDPDWATYWRVRPLIVTPLAGAAGAVVTYFTFHLLTSWRWPRLIIWPICIVIMLVALWLGTILGLAGTMWN